MRRVGRAGLLLRLRKNLSLSPCRQPRTFSYLFLAQKRYHRRLDAARHAPGRNTIRFCYVDVLARDGACKKVKEIVDNF
jgi:hypothetical protein